MKRGPDARAHNDQINHDEDRKYFYFGHLHRIRNDKSKFQNPMTNQNFKIP
jgi:hypothetical protein